jgi:hypothetical protein
VTKQLGICRGVHDAGIGLQFSTMNRYRESGLMPSKPIRIDLGGAQNGPHAPTLVGRRAAGLERTDIGSSAITVST